MDPKKVAAVADIDPSSINSLEAVRSFLGLCSYYRRFIRHVAAKAALILIYFIISARQTYPTWERTASGPVVARIAYTTI
eukprot:scaffold124246_cov35-Tisochrysis_lutea.AAC.1